MPDLAAAIGIHQLVKLRQMRDRRQVIANKYMAAFSDFPIRLPIPRIASDEHAWHLFIIQLELDEIIIGRDRFIELMSEEGIGTSVHFIPLHMQPYWRDKYGLKLEDFPVATAVFERIVSLPIYSKMTDSDIDRVIQAVRKIATKYSK